MARKIQDRYLECRGCKASVPTAADAKDFGWYFVDGEWLCDACGYVVGNGRGLFDDDDDWGDDD